MSCFGQVWTQYYPTLALEQTTKRQYLNKTSPTYTILTFDFSRENTRISFSAEYCPVGFYTECLLEKAAIFSAPALITREIMRREDAHAHSSYPGPRAF